MTVRPPKANSRWALPSIETIQKYSTVRRCTEEEIRAVENEKKSRRRNSSKPIPPKHCGHLVTDGRGGRKSNEPLVSRSKAFGGVLRKYLEAGDKQGYIREYARLWKKARKQEQKPTISPCQ